MTAITLKLNTAATARTAKPAARRGCPRRFLTWELAGVLTLMGSSAAYALFTLTHLA